ncbi:MAG TPA: DUF2911 domain-containing protein, partial [Chitinophagaceae bacterium]|nr:DUF2911 domain-containing protein [Chitinophagaceae bacterium]
FFIGLAISIIAPACEGHRKSPHESVEAENIKIIYGRPYKKGRQIFGGLEKYGKVWRTGADEATEIIFAKDGSFGGQAVKAGTYSLYTIPNEKEWTIILNSQTGQMGIEYNKNRDVLRVQAPAHKLDEVVEQLTIRFDENNMIIEWDKTQVKVPVDF